MPEGLPPYAINRITGAFESAADRIVQEVTNAASFAFDQMKCRAMEAAAEHDRPSIMLSPALSRDGNRWIALYGENLQDGVAGFGDSPALAFSDFDRAWTAKLPAPRTLAKHQPCGCVVCTCRNEAEPDRCLGCGAKNCGTPECVFKGSGTPVYAEDLAAPAPGKGA